MTITTGSTHLIGPKTATDRLYRVTDVEERRPFGVKRYTAVTIVRITDDTTWQVYVKPDAKRIPWNARLMSVTTNDDRLKAIETAKAENRAAKFDKLTDILAGTAEQELHASYQEDMQPVALKVSYTCSGHKFRAWITADNSYAWKHHGMSAYDKTTDVTVLTMAFARWCGSRSA